MNTYVVIFERTVRETYPVELQALTPMQARIQATETLKEVSSLPWDRVDGSESEPKVLHIETV